MKKQNNKHWTHWEHLQEYPAKTPVYLVCPSGEIRKAQFTAGFSLTKTELYTFKTNIFKAETAAEFNDIVLMEGYGIELEKD